MALDPNTGLPIDTSNPLKPTGTGSGNEGQDTGGNYTPQNQSVADRVTGMLQTGSPLLDAAQTKSTQAYNAKGLANSSMAAQAGTEALINTATPIATADANNIAAQNLSKQNAGQTGALQGQQIAGNITTTGMTTGSQEKQTGMQVAGQLQQTQMQTASAQLINQNTIDANRADLLSQLGSNEKIAAGQQALALQQTGMQLTSQQLIDANDLKAAMDRTTASNTSAQTIAAGTVAEQNQSNIAAAVSNANASYTTAFNGIMSNPNISAEDRSAYLESIKNQQTATINTIETTFNTKLNWTPPVTPKTPDTLNIGNI